MAIPSSSSGCCCEQEVSTSTPTISGVSGTFGCSGSTVACLTITNGVVTSATNRAIGDGATGSAGCSGLEVPCIEVNGGYVTSISNRTLTIPPPGTLDATAGSTGLNVPNITVVDGVVTSLSDRVLTIPAPGTLNATAGESGFNIPNISVVNGVVTSLSNRTLTVLPSNLGQQSATSGQVITWNGSQWSPASIPAPGSVSGSAGSSGLNVPNLSVSNGVVTSISDRTLTILPSNLGQQSATSGQVIAWNGSQWAPATPSGTDTNSSAYTFYDSTGINLNITENASQLPFPDTAEPSIVILDFVPTSIRMTLRVLGATSGAGTGTYFGLQYSTNSGSTWFDTGLRCYATVSEVLSVVTHKVNVTIASSPVWFRLISFCSTGGTGETATIRQMTATFIK